MRVAARAFARPLFYSYTPRAAAIPAAITAVRTMSVSPSGSPAPKKAREDAPAATSANGTSGIEIPAPTSATPVKANKPKQGPKFQGKAKRKRNRRTLPDPYSHGDVLLRDIDDFLGAEYIKDVIAKGDESEYAAPEELELQKHVELRIGALGVNGELLSRAGPVPQSASLELWKCQIEG